MITGVNKVAFVNGKGGCGKTMGIFHTAGVLSRKGEKVLVIDLDKQRNSSDRFLMYNEDKPRRTVYDVMMGTAMPEDATGRALFPTKRNGTPKYYGVDCLVSDVRLENEMKLHEVNGSEFGQTISRFINQQGYTWVLVDMPPSNMALNELCLQQIVDYVIAPFSSDMDSINGYGDIVDIVDAAREKNPTISILGIYLARFRRNLPFENYIKNQLKQLVKDDVFIDIQIPDAIDLRESAYVGRPISYYKLHSDSRTAFELLVQTISDKIKADVNKK